MQGTQGTSLLFALLEVAYPQASSQAAKYRNDLDPGDREKVLKNLYRALYSIIDDYELPYNRMLSRALGKALSMGIREEMAKKNPDEDIKRLYDMLKPVATEAIDELAP